jgi:hypothetical protein
METFRLDHSPTGRSITNQRPKTRLETKGMVLYSLHQRSIQHGGPIERHGGQHDAPPLASRHRLHGWELDVLDRDGAFCGRMMHICDHRYRHFYTLEGPVELVCKLNPCPNPDGPGHAQTKSPEMELAIALPAWAIAWDVFCGIGITSCGMWPNPCWMPTVMPGFQCGRKWVASGALSSRFSNNGIAEPKSQRRSCLSPRA